MFYLVEFGKIIIYFVVNNVDKPTCLITCLAIDHSTVKKNESFYQIKSLDAAAVSSETVTRC